MRVCVMGLKQTYMFFLLLTCVASLAASDKSEQKDTIDERAKEHGRSCSPLTIALVAKSLQFAVDTPRNNGPALSSNTSDDESMASARSSQDQDKITVLSALKSSKPVEMSLVYSSLR